MPTSTAGISILSEDLGATDTSHPFVGISHLFSNILRILDQEGFLQAFCVFTEALVGR
jgi:hypothetical protein